MKTDLLVSAKPSSCWLANAFLFYVVLSAGCFSSPTAPNVATLKCESNQDCPIGYECKAKGQPGGCCKPGALICPIIVISDGASPEAFSLDQGTTTETSAETGGGDGRGTPFGDAPLGIDQTTGATGGTIGLIDAGGLGGAGGAAASATGGAILTGGNVSAGSTATTGGTTTTGGITAAGGAGGTLDAGLPDAVLDAPIRDVAAEGSVADAPGTCSIDKDCPAQSPLCLGSKCAKCAADTDCIGRTGTPACAAISGLCVVCTANSYCTGDPSKGFCVTNACVGCGAAGSTACSTRTDGKTTCAVGGTVAGQCAACSPSDVRCSTDGVPQLCSSSGAWQDQTACAAGSACSAGTCVCSKTTCPSGCADTAADSKNCGSCGHDCLGGACLTGHCQPAVVVSSTTAQLSVIGVDSTSLYYEADAGSDPLSNTANTAYRISKTAQNAAGAPLDSGDFERTYWGVIGTKLFFSPVPEEFRYCDINSTDPNHCSATTTVMPGPGMLASFKSQTPPAQYFALVDSTPLTGATITWYSTSGTLVKTATDTPSAFGTSYVSVFAYGDAVYWLRSYLKADLTTSGETLYTASAASPTLTYLTNEEPASTYYVIEATTKSVLLLGPSNGLYRVVRADGNPNANPPLLYSTGNATTITGATEDANAVYWQQSDGTLNSCLPTFCQRQTLVFGQDFSGQWQQDDSALYWATSTGSGGQVMRLAK